MKRDAEEMARRLNIRLLDHLPEGWRVLKGALTAPVGYVWVCNRKSILRGEYEHALMKEGI